MAQSDAQRGKVTGTPVGCACGDGVVDWKRIIEIVKSTGKDIVFSVECGTIDQAVRSFEHLSRLYKWCRVLGGAGYWVQVN